MLKKKTKNLHIAFIIYQIIAHIFLPIIIIVDLIKFLFLKQTWETTRLRYGIIKKEKECDIWFHAASDGEIKTVYNVYEAIISDEKAGTLRPRLTAANPHALYRGTHHCDFFSHPLPYDLFWCLIPLMRQQKGRPLIIIEGEIWPALIWLSRAYNIKIHSLGTRIHERAFRRYKRIRRFFQPFMSLYETVSTQSEEDAKRWRQFSQKESSTSITVIGSLKWPKHHIGPDSINTHATVRKTLAIISAHEDDIKALAKGLKSACDAGWACWVLPRRPEWGIRWLKKAENLFDGISPKRCDDYTLIPENPPGIWIIPRFGITHELLSRVHASIIGGSFSKNTGSHNVLEPIAYGHKVLSGPYRGPFEAIDGDLIIPIHDAENELLPALMSLPLPDQAFAWEKIKSLRQKMESNLRSWWETHIASNERDYH